MKRRFEACLTLIDIFLNSSYIDHSCELLVVSTVEGYKVELEQIKSVQSKDDPE